MKLSLEKNTLGGFALALILLVGLGLISYFSTVRLTDDADSVKHTQEVKTALAALLSTMTDAETGARGFLITGDEKYLEPYRDAVASADAEFGQLRRLTGENPRQQRRLDTMGPLIAARLKVARDVVEVRRADGFIAAQQVVVAGKGKEKGSVFTFTLPQGKERAKA